MILTTFGPILDYHISDRILNIDYVDEASESRLRVDVRRGRLGQLRHILSARKIFSSVVPSHRTSENIDHLRHRILLFRQGGVSALKSWRGDDIFWLHHLRVNALQNDVSKGGVDVVVKNTATSVPDRRRIDYRMFSPFNICVRSVLSLFSSNVVNLRHVRSGVQTGSGVDPFSCVSCHSYRRVSASKSIVGVFPTTFASFKTSSITFPLATVARDERREQLFFGSLNPRHRQTRSLRKFICRSK